MNRLFALIRTLFIVYIRCRYLLRVVKFFILRPYRLIEIYMALTIHITLNNTLYCYINSIVYVLCHKYIL